MKQSITGGTSVELLLIAQQPHQHFNIAKRRRRKRRRQHLYSMTKRQDRGNEWLLDFHTFSQRRRGGVRDGGNICGTF